MKAWTHPKIVLFSGKDNELLMCIKVSSETDSTYLRQRVDQVTTYNQYNVNNERNIVVHFQCYRSYIKVNL